MKFSFDNIYDDNKFKADLKANDITVLVGPNGHGKTAFLNSMKCYADKKKIPCVAWSDMEFGRQNGKSLLLMNGHTEALAEMSFRSEGESILASFAHFFMGRARSVAQKAQTDRKKKMFLLLDQLDSGLDIHQLDEIKAVIKDTVLPDITDRGITVFVVMSANSYEMVAGEDCLDPVTGEHHRFDTLESFRRHINETYKQYERNGQE